VRLVRDSTLPRGKRARALAFLNSLHGTRGCGPALASTKQEELKLCLLIIGANSGVNKLHKEEKPISMWPIGFFIAGLVFMFLSWVLQDVDRTTAMAPEKAMNVVDTR
jgi:hypothetical protein